MGKTKQTRKSREKGRERGQIENVPVKQHPHAILEQCPRLSLRHVLMPTLTHNGQGQIRTEARGHDIVRERRANHIQVPQERLAVLEPTDQDLREGGEGGNEYKNLEKIRIKSKGQNASLPPLSPFLTSFHNGLNLFRLL